MQPPEPTAPSMRYRGNTGVKSVLADYAEHKEMQRLEAEIKQMKLEWAIKKQSVTTKTVREEELEKQHQREEDEQKTEEKDDIDKLLEDDDFFEQYKNQKIQEIKSTKAYVAISGGWHLHRKTYGFLGSVSRDTFIDAVENEPLHVFVVIHVFQEVASHLQSWLSSVVQAMHRTEQDSARTSHWIPLREIP